jgi:hypothetical protein
MHALKIVWIGAAPFGTLGFNAVICEKYIPLHAHLDTQYGLEIDGKKLETEQGDSSTAKTS